MNILLQTLLLLGGINLIAARYLQWGSGSLGGDLYRSPFVRHSPGMLDYEDFHHKFFDDYPEEGIPKQPVISQSNYELDGKEFKDLDSLLRAVLGDYGDDGDDDEKRKIADESKEIPNEKDVDDKSDNDDDNDDKNEKDVDDKSDNDDDNDDKNEKNDDDKSDNDDDNDDKNEKDVDDKSENDDKNDNDDNDNKDDNDANGTKEDTKEDEDEIIDKSNEEKLIKSILTVADELLVLDKSSEESNETLTVNQDDNEDDDTEHVKTISVANGSLEKHELSEKEIRELTAFLVTLSTMEDLLKVVEHINEEDNSKDAEEVFEQKLKEVDSFMGLFVNTLDTLLEESSEVDKDSGKSENDDDDIDNDKDKDDSKDDNDNDNDDDDDKKQKEASVEDNKNEDASVSLEFHSVDTPLDTHNMDTHKYNVVERSTTTAQNFQPTSSPLTTEPYTTTGNPNAAIIHEYVVEREQLDELQENLLENKLNMDKDFYHIIANEGDDKNLQKFGNDIAALRENIFKMKQSIDAMQDIKSKLYFHQLIKSALKDYVHIF